jgi:hypothetical protein
MLKSSGYICAVLGVGPVAIAWSHNNGQHPPIQRAETIAPEKLLPGGSPLPDLQFRDLSFVYVDDN